MTFPDAAVLLLRLISAMHYTELTTKRWIPLFQQYNLLRYVFFLGHWILCIRSIYFGLNDLADTILRRPLVHAAKKWSLQAIRIPSQLS